MQSPDGHLQVLGQRQGQELLDAGYQNLVKIGDVFRIRDCCFRVDTINRAGITAKGISKPDYQQALRQRAVERGLDGVVESLAASHARLACRRNEPCPCGSGKKYKFCCGSAANINPQGKGLS